mmetsp:Transcript_4907/g.7403  ORF Transcript_4907/g.7403 Transcript_4907/m.7403 type:complete len:352 (-) Transcript_4907:244-1299(-)|eukprot:CAMPEP_0113944638 /NCGR_PEP_ID=MMETSP1339-20121228/35075_1 /TAXON_ID=94617 /ORGANISM="Fibrocapsa japonica" /LENGTH=351 /DNA_ID=CAMNT_0000949913 /DNA_START=28 /DNA_END=1083 /DNA_ORIENTATION=+ /assembly_acc=CAM_ASM_000762
MDEHRILSYEGVKEADQAGSFWFLVPDCVLFGIVAGLCLNEVWKTKIPRGEVELSAGMEMRRWFHILLFASVAARTLSLIIQIALIVAWNQPCHVTAGCTVVKALPELLFLSTYSLLVLFWAQLSYTAAGVTVWCLVPSFLAANVAFYIALVVAIIFTSHHDLAVLQTAFQYLLGFFYLIVLIFLLYYGPLVASQIKTSSPERVRVFRTLLFAMMLFAAILILRCLYCFGNAISIFGWKTDSPPSMDAYLFEALTHLMCEFFPAIVVLVVMRKRSQSRRGSLMPLGGSVGGAGRSTPPHFSSSQGVLLPPMGGHSMPVPSYQHQHQQEIITPPSVTTPSSLSTSVYTQMWR